MAKRQTGKNSNAALKREHNEEIRSSGVVGRRKLVAVEGSADMPLNLDRVIHEHVRLAIVSALAVNEVLSFNDLKKMLDASDGNLSVHARKLEEAGYVECRKSFAGRVPRTEYSLTSTGKEALEQYIAHMEALIKRVGGDN